MTFEEIGRIVLAEVGADECMAGYATTVPALVGRLALAYGDVNADGSFN